MDDLETYGINITVSTLLDDDDCGCPSIGHDLVLPPYIVVVFSVLVLTALSLIVNICELKLRFGYTNRQIKSLAGSATLAALAAPPWFFLAPQALYHIGHLVYIIVATFEEDSGLSKWDRYELAYGRWINGGASVFIVFGTIGAYYTKKMVEGERSSEETIVDNKAELGTSVDVDNFRKQFLAAGTIQEMDELQEKSAAKIQIMGDHQEWERGAKIKSIAAFLVGLCMLPCISTHILTGVVLWAWIHIPILILLHVMCTVFLVRRNRRTGLIPRIVALDLALALYAITLQDAFNYTLLFYEGENYLSLIWETISAHHNMVCFFCRIFHDIDHLFNIISFL
eukprot:TRINITY_DN18251_c0_g1_i2.p1 TRINITY_DN18251_c0_g1~~TRINITY_DN18251_c0_g1_i2.p1  ORF type:complete len:340 (+),score=48.14 TRINITY_DN18251_c0_g1_i2:54-1073(+)